MGFTAWGLRFRVRVFRFGIQGLRFEVYGLGFRVWGLGSKTSSGVALARQGSFQYSSGSLSTPYSGPYPQPGCSLEIFEKLGIM